MKTKLKKKKFAYDGQKFKNNLFHFIIKYTHITEKLNIAPTFYLFLWKYEDEGS